ncbi:AGR202Wp [Eremothecium gossypii ATCC 10895]|uniref:COPII coat assembly protein SEC16 n=1 Tax=Eremothecium gossypii (strain ATCC 10895 / CBS 109.51 / FGSC 9923 / NRRL Y-1056) TaxID=284811 RepID=SEC16_EREGS|nr:AGR202Wp [Eremothecium gossypii ATCC 10895]Q74ZJ8.1 RecName: Full=COPII coat assembly protein SEC16; AltName: Full=Protein transport protein SEC16 [Eremothecium gossypii ATCC 10895]AAS54692.1 AGR202Wp [Eremothecium gossypii ATCC 10895]AEY99022.1 FAGR202Wp [Eremothecium gossypii FDAG1]
MSTEAKRRRNQKKKQKQKQKKAAEKMQEQASLESTLGSPIDVSIFEQQQYGGAEDAEAAGAAAARESADESRGASVESSGSTDNAIGDDRAGSAPSPYVAVGDSAAVSTAVEVSAPLQDEAFSAVDVEATESPASALPAASVEESEHVSIATPAEPSAAPVAPEAAASEENVVQMAGENGTNPEADVPIEDESNFLFGDSPHSPLPWDDGGASDPEQRPEMTEERPELPTFEEERTQHTSLLPSTSNEHKTPQEALSSEEDQAAEPEQNIGVCDGHAEDSTVDVEWEQHTSSSELFGEEHDTPHSPLPWEEQEAAAPEENRSRMEEHKESISGDERDQDVPITEDSAKTGSLPEDTVPGENTPGDIPETATSAKNVDFDSANGTGNVPVESQAHSTTHTPEEYAADSNSLFALEDDGGDFLAELSNGHDVSSQSAADMLPIDDNVPRTTFDGADALAGPAETYEPGDLFADEDTAEEPPWAQNTNPNVDTSQQLPVSRSSAELSSSQAAKETPGIEVPPPMFWDEESDSIEASNDQLAFTPVAQRGKVTLPDKKFSFLDNDDDLLNDDEEEEANAGDQPENDQENCDDDSFLDSDEEPPLLPPKAGKTTYTPSTQVLGQDRSSYDAHNLSSSMAVSPAVAAVTGQQQFLPGPPVPEKPKVGKYALPKQPNPPPQTNKGYYAPTLGGVGLEATDKPPVLSVNDESVRRLEEEKKKSDAYDFPLELVKSKPKPAKPVPVPSIPSIVTASQPASRSFSPSDAQPVFSPEKAGITPLKPTVPPVKNPYQPNFDGNYLSLVDAVNSRTSSVQQNPYAPPPVNVGPQVTSEKPYAAYEGAASGSQSQHPFPPQPLGAYGTNAPKPPLNSYNLAAAQMDSPKERRPAAYVNTSRTRAISNASVGSSGSYNSHQLPAGPTVVPPRFAFPPPQAHISPTIPALQTVGIAGAPPAVSSPGTQRRTHARSHSSVYAPANAPHASKYAPTVHPSVQQKYPSVAGPSKRSLAGNGVPDGVSNRVLPPTIQEVPVDGHALNFRQFPLFNWSQTSKIVYGLSLPIDTGNYMLGKPFPVSGIHVRNSESILVPNVILKDFPGPLIKGKTRTKDLEKWLELSIAYQRESLPGRDLTLWYVLKHKLSTSGSLRELSKILYDSDQLIPYMGQMHSHGRPTLLSHKLDPNSQMQILAHLQVGSPGAALDLALAQKDYALALVLSSLIGKDKWSEVVDTYLREEFSVSAGNNQFSVYLLALIFQVFVGNSNRVLQELTANPLKRDWAIQDWNIILAAVLNNIPKDVDPRQLPPVVMEFLVGFGVFLVQSGKLAAGAVCFVIANVPLSQNELLPHSGVKFECLGSINSLDAVLLSEVYEYYYTTINDNCPFFASLLLMKTVHASALLDYGLPTTVPKYLDVITGLLRNAPKNSAIAVSLTHQLESINLRLSGVTTAWIGKPTLSSVWGQLDKSFNKFIGGDADDFSKQPEKTVFDSFTPSASRNASMVDLNHGVTPMRPSAIKNSGVNRSHTDLPVSNKGGYAPLNAPGSNVFSVSRSNNHPHGTEHGNSMSNLHGDSQHLTHKTNYTPHRASNLISPKYPEEPQNSHLPNQQSNLPSPANGHSRNPSIPSVATPPPIFSAPPKRARGKYAATASGAVSVDQLYSDAGHSNTPTKVKSVPTCPEIAETPAALATRQATDSMTDFFAPPLLQAGLQQDRRSSAYSASSQGILPSSRRSSNISDVMLPPKKSGSGKPYRKTTVNYTPIDMEASSLAPSSVSLSQSTGDTTTEVKRARNSGEASNSSATEVADSTVLHKSPESVDTSEYSFPDESVQSWEENAEDDQDPLHTVSAISNTEVPVDKRDGERGSQNTLTKAAPYSDLAPYEHEGNAPSTESPAIKGSRVQVQVQVTPPEDFAHIQSQVVSPEKEASPTVEKGANANESSPDLHERQPYAGLGVSYNPNTGGPRPFASHQYLPRAPAVPAYSPIEENAAEEGRTDNQTKAVEKQEHAVLKRTVSGPVIGSEKLMSPALAHPIPRTSRFEPIKEIIQNDEDTFRKDKVPVIRASSNPNFNPYTPVASEQYYDDVVEDESDDSEEESERKRQEKEKEEERKREAAEKEKRKNEGGGSSRWFGWLKKDTNEKKPIKAKLGQKNNFYYDEKLKRWVNKDATEEEKQKVSTPPPPPPVVKRKMNTTPEIKPRSGSVVGGPAIRTQGAVAPVNPQDPQPCQAVVGASSALQKQASPVKPRDPAINLTSKKANGLDDLISLTAGPSNAVSRRKKKPGRGYVNVLNNL